MGAVQIDDAQRLAMDSVNLVTACSFTTRAPHALENFNVYKLRLLHLECWSSPRRLAGSRLAPPVDPAGPDFRTEAPKRRTFARAARLTECSSKKLGLETT